MNLDLPEDLEKALRAEVDRGRYPSVDAAIVDAICQLLGVPGEGPTIPGAESFTGPMKEFIDMRDEVAEIVRRRRRGELPMPPAVGSMREFADELDEIVEDAMRRRREEARWSAPHE